MNHENELTLSSSWVYHDSSICSINVENKDVFSISTEKLTRFKHDGIYPIEAIKSFLSYKDIQAESVQKLNLILASNDKKTHLISKDFYTYEKGIREFFSTKYKKDVAKKTQFLKKFQKNILNELSEEDKFQKNFKNAIINHAKKEITVQQAAIDALKEIFINADINVTHYDHHLCHAASGYYISNFDDALVITNDGSGDGVFSRVYTAKNGQLSLIASSERIWLDFEGTRGRGTSLGNIYQYFTEYYGFEVPGDEGKVEALAAYGKPITSIYNDLIQLLILDKNSNKLVLDEKLFREKFDAITMRNYFNTYSKEDLAATVQKFFEDKTLEYIQHFLNLTSLKNLILVGGSSANVISNMKIFEQLTDKIFIPPAMGDDGLSFGANILYLLDNGYSKKDINWLKESMPYYGTSYTKEEVEKSLIENNDSLSFKFIGEDWVYEAAKRISNKEIGALFNGRMEWGPRALGNRSIIANVQDPEMRDKINAFIKNRPYFQPFCPSILIEEKDRLFEKAYNNKHMTCAFKMKKEFHKKLPSAIHIDGTARAQFVSKEDNEKYYNFLQKVKELTGFGVVINTSFNKHGRTIVESPNDAIKDFLDTNLDFMIIEGFLVERKEKIDLRINALIEMSNSRVSHERWRTSKKEPYRKSNDYDYHLTRLREDGYSVIPNFYTKDKCNEIKKEIDSLCEQLKGTERLTVDKYGSDHRIFGAERLSKNINEFYQDKLLLDIGENYFGGKMLNSNTLATKLLAKEGNIGSGGGWHRDGHHFQFKAIVYLSDVEITNGPFQIIRGSHWHKQALEDMYLMGIESQTTRYTDEQIQKVIQSRPDDYKVMTAKAGTLLLVDTSTLHTGMKIDRDSRYTLFNYYYPSYDNIKARLKRWNVI